MMDAHLTEEQLEALSSGRDDLVSAEAREHLHCCDSCRTLVAIEKRVGNEIAFSFRQEDPVPDDLNLLVSRVVADAPVAPSRSAWLLALATGASATVGFGALSVGRWPSVANAIEWLRSALAAFRAVDRVVESQIPGSWGLLSLCAVAVVLMFMGAGHIVAKRRGRVPFAPMGMLGVWMRSLLIGVFLASAPASAAAQPTYSGNWEGADELRDALDTALVGQDVNVIRRDGEITIKARVDKPSPAVGAKTAESPFTGEHTRYENLLHREERVSFLGNVVVAENESVESAVAMAGDVIVRGQVRHEAVAMAGDVIIEPGGEVLGETVSMAGKVVHRSADGSETLGENARSWRKRRPAPATPEVAAPQPSERPGEHGGAEHGGAEPTQRSGLSDMLRRAAQFAMLFVLGLLLLGISHDRYRIIQRRVAKAPGSAFGFGVVMLVVGTVASVVLTLTLVGIPVALAVIATLSVAAYLGLAMVASVAGGLLPVPVLSKRPIAQLATGVTMLFLLSLVPVLGPAALVILTGMGMGAVLGSGFGKSDIR